MSLAYKANSADVLTDVLGTLRLKGRVFCSSEFSAPWSMKLPPSNFAHFHVVERGGGWLKLHGEEGTVPLASGDLVVVPHGRGHVLSDSPKTKPVPLDKLLARKSAEQHILRHGGGGAQTHMICGSFEFENATENPVLSLLPPLIHIRSYGGGGGGGRASEWLELTLKLLAHEARHARQGSGTVITRLTDIIFVQAVRAWIEDQPLDQGGWLGALRDLQIGAALGLIHRVPERAWSVARLAGEVGMSRSPFAAKFTALVGVPPLSYLSRWRMQLAASLLQNEKLNISEVAARVGYDSEAAFSKAFKRRFGLAPSAYRRQNSQTVVAQIAA